CMQSLEFPWTS
nr:immunoglobulin light chain junction region [Macaca mulatta]MOV84464.1 immunoglobulin light chain junction region [Macaca mulatta]MOV84766.1 immunoglobulin light chain junction region [Macaca mulatta]MOV85505.1 immunoglobulin light chain junction region [Macaca mulatta]